MIRIVKKENFEQRKEALYSKVNDENDLAQMVQSLMFKVGTRLNLTIEITDEYLSQNIYALLYHNQLIENADLLGFNVIGISKECVDKDALIKRLQDMIDIIMEGHIHA